MEEQLKLPNPRFYLKTIISRTKSDKTKHEAVFRYFEYLAYSTKAEKEELANRTYKGELICEPCGLEFASPEEMEQHVDRSHDVKHVRGICNVCGRKFCMFKSAVAHLEEFH